MSYETILYQTEKGRARITLNRPDKRNALSEQLLFELGSALWEADNDKAVHCVIIRGAGGAFSAGYDMTAGYGKDSGGGSQDTGKTYRNPRDTFDDDVWRLERSQRLRMAIFDMHKPVIAQVHGHCLAGGTDVAFLCDMVIAADDANIGFPPVRAQGVPPNQMWVYHCGPQWAKRLLLTGDTVSGADAAKIGLVMKSVPADRLEAEVEQLADRLALVDQDLLSANKRVINLGLELMGARTLQRIAAESDARGHLSPGATAFRQMSKSEGLKAAFQHRDGRFGDGRARVDGPEIRDAGGRLVKK